MPESPTFNLILTCPRCGDKNFLRRGEGFECAACGEFSYPEDMSPMAQEISAKTDSSVQSVRKERSCRNMHRNSFSYRLTAKPRNGPLSHNISDVLNALNESDLAGFSGFIRMIFNINGNEIRGEVNPYFGVIKEDTRLIDCINDIAKAFPDYIFTFDENDEEDHSVARHTEWANGVRGETSRRRTIEPDELDRTTINTIVRFLNDAYPDAGAAVQKKFLPTVS